MWVFTIYKQLKIFHFHCTPVVSLPHCPPVPPSSDLLVLRCTAGGHKNGYTLEEVGEKEGEVMMVEEVVASMHSLLSP